MPTCSPMASPALTTRFITTCRSWVASPSIGGNVASRSYRMCTDLATDTDRRWAISRTIALTSRVWITNRPLPEYASIWRAKSAARWDATSICWRFSRTGDSGASSESARLALPRIATSRLLKSWAIPPASMPRLSSFWDSCIRRSIVRCSDSAWRIAVTSRKTTTTPVSVPSARRMGAAPSSMTRSVPPRAASSTGAGRVSISPRSTTRPMRSGIGARSSSLRASKTSANGRPVASACDHPVRRSATALRRTMRPVASVAMTPSAMLRRVTSSRSCSASS